MTQLLRIDNILGMSTTTKLYCAVSNDGYLYGATEDLGGLQRKYWAPHYDSDQDQTAWGLQTIDDVPLELAERLEKVGTGLQDFTDGYEAWAAAARYTR